MCALEWGKIIADVLKSSFWPGAVAFACWYFRDDLKSMAARVTEAGPTKLILSPPSQEPISVQTPTSPSDGSASALENVGSTAEIAASIARIKANISAEQLEPQFEKAKIEMPADVRNNPQQTIDFLIYAAVALSIQLGHERTYRSIFGSQMNAMLKMNAPGGVDRSTVQAVYDAVAAVYPDMYPHRMSFEGWLQFLTVSNLASIDAAGKFHLTPTGRGFLRYILDNKLNPEKPF